MQVHDKHIIKRLKVMKYKNALKCLQGEMGEAAPPRIPIPKLSRIEHYINLVEAWRQVDVSDLHTLLPDVKVVPDT